MERAVSIDVTDYYHEEAERSTTDLADHRETKSAPSSPINRNREIKSTEEYVIVTLDIEDDSLRIVSVEPYSDGRESADLDTEPMLTKSVVKHPVYPHRKRADPSDVLRGLNMYIRKTDAGWMAVEKRFHKLTAKTYWLLPRSKFGECIGINSKEFALELFDTLARRRNITRKEVNKDDLRRFWCQITDQSFHSRLEIYFEMADKDGDGRLTEDGVREFVRITASANNKPVSQKLANEYTEIIIKASDTGYITMEILEELLVDMDRLSLKTYIEEENKSTKRWYNNVVGEISSSYLYSCFNKRASTTKT